MAEGERDDPLLYKRRELIRHPWPSTLSRTQRAKSLSLDLAFPGVVGRAVDTERATGSADPDPPSQVDQL
jgi:hypothetical protein